MPQHYTSFFPSVGAELQQLRCAQTQCAHGLTSVTAYNPGKTTVFMQLHGSGLVELGKKAPLFVVPLPPGGSNAFLGNFVMSCGDTIYVAVTTEPSGADAPEKPVLLSLVWS